MNTLLVADDGPVRTLTFNRPERLNAFTAEAYATVAGALREADATPSVRVVVLRGAGRAFSSGVDLRALTEGDPTEFVESFTSLVDALVTMSTPIVAGVQGPAVGFGATLLLHCDVVIVTDDARLRYPFTELGTAPEAGSSWLLPATIGAQRAAELILTARWVPGEEAVSIGLAARCVPTRELDDAVRDVATQIASHAGTATVAAKRLLRTAARSAVPAAMAREFEAARALADELGDIGR
jgi:enoyl-CoA hydratase/carnithine racemase